MEARRVAKGLPIDTGRSFTPAEAQAMLARLVANPIPVTNRTMTQDSYYSPTMGYQRVNFVPGKPGYHIEDPRIEDQSAKPEKPETRFVTASTYGRVIPISLGRRRLEGNLIQASNLTPKLVGTTTKTIEYEIPIYEDPPVDEELGFVLDTSGGTDPGGTGEDCGKGDSCDTRSPTPPTPPSDPGDTTTIYYQIQDPAGCLDPSEATGYTASSTDGFGALPLWPDGPSGIYYVSFWTSTDNGLTFELDHCIDPTT